MHPIKATSKCHPGQKGFTSDFKHKNGAMVGIFGLKII